MVNVEVSVEVVNLMFQRLCQQSFRLDSDRLAVAVQPLGGDGLGAGDFTVLFAREAGDITGKSTNTPALVADEY